jgi:hypothetical protein
MLKENKLTSAYNLKSISQMPDHFTYQHPTNGKQTSNSKEDEWVKSFLDNGGTEKQLMEKADAGRAVVWKRIKFKRPKSTKTKTAPDTKKVSKKVTKKVSKKVVKAKKPVVLHKNTKIPVKKSGAKCPKGQH